MYSYAPELIGFPKQTFFITYLRLTKVRYLKFLLSLRYI